MSLVFREALAADVAAVVALLTEDPLGRSREGADLAPYRAAFAALQDEPGNLLIVGEQDGRVVACYQLTAISNLSLGATRRAQVEGVRVAPDLRGHGAGTELMRDAEARAREMGCGLLQLTTNKVREDAHRFYERLGFTASHIGFKRELT